MKDRVKELPAVAARRARNLLTAPIIYGLIIPLGFLDLCVSLYQTVCFPVYGIAKVRRRDYFVFDRHRLNYLNGFDKLHCTYCAYANGLLAYTGEIAALTEEYFCPIKHAGNVHTRHSRYARFLEYGDAADYEARLEAYRQALEADRNNKANPPTRPGSS
jgi:hypothetical protein